MKHIYIFLLFAVVATVPSCSNLEEDPIGLLAPESFFRTPTDVETATLGAYAWLANESLYGRRLTLTLQLRGDMCDIGDRNTPGRRQNVNDFEMGPDNGMTVEIWPTFYQLIGTTNAVIEGAQQLPDGPDAAAAYVAEARFLRAFSYYHLVRLFGEIPYIDFFITDPASVGSIEKTSVDVVYENIIADLQAAKAGLPDAQPGGVRSRPTRGTAASYLASVYLTRGNWQEAYNEAKFVIDNRDAFGYRLMEDYADLYKARTADGLAEHIFAVDFLNNQSGPSGQNVDFLGPVTGIRAVTTPDAPNGGWSVSVPSLKVYTTWDDRDYRKEVSFIDSAMVDGVWSGYEAFAPNHNSPRPHMSKFFEFCGDNRGDCGVSDNNYVAFRYAEVLLIAAEAGLEAGIAESEVLGYLNEVRERARFGSDFPMDVAPGMAKDDLIDLILDDRRLELSFEFKRWYDIKRRQLGTEVFTGDDSLEPHPNFDPNRDYLMPIPQDELDRNANLGPQNPGY
ncbi:RagB/SusD family nutrient uptake outer membrane protein [Lewinella sp. IMCC34191]|uniref:RagB/SusD family nutrient uptake outer membrane protein n=1 Tax=Lewinella sp. IMCC34191 TaxID=2259172 RepID=UPI000E23D936|nr:RagB/SusD family nutrient uptake outer membrane protein [Lewinella sp. IMCC34191]